VFFDHPRRGAERILRLELQVRKMDLVDLTAPAGREEELLSGRLLGAGVVTGRLHQGLPLLTDAEGLLSLHAREGRIHQELPPFDAEAVVGLFFFRTLDSSHPPGSGAKQSHPRAG
jgi:hypothetical protein